MTFSPISAQMVLPHRPPMLLVDQLLDYSTETVRAKALVSPHNPFLSADGRLDPCASIEMLAQTVAMQISYPLWLQGKQPLIGYLAGVSDFHLTDARAQVHEELALEAHQTLSLGQASVFEGRVLRDGQLMAGGTLKVWQTEERPLISDSAESALVDGNSLMQGLLASMKSLESEASKSEVTATFVFDETFAGFRGHFPGSPLLPGVAMLRLVVFVAEQGLQRTLKLNHVDQAKFMNVVKPGQDLCAECALDMHEADLRIKAVLHGGKTVVARMNLSMVDDPA